MATEMSTDSLLSTLLSKDCGKGKEVSAREAVGGGGERSPSWGVREEKLVLLLCCLSVCLCVGIKRHALASRPGQPLWKISLILVWTDLLSVLWCLFSAFSQSLFRSEMGGRCCNGSGGAPLLNGKQSGYLASVATRTCDGTVTEATFPSTDENSKTIAAVMKTCCNRAVPTGGTHCSLSFRLCLFQLLWATVERE